MGASCGGTVTASLVWIPWFPGDVPPPKIYLREISSAIGRGMAQVPVLAPSCSADNGIGTDVILENRTENGVNYRSASAAGHRIIEQIVPISGRISFQRTPSASGSESSVSYRLLVTEFVYQIRSSYDATFKAGPRDADGRATPVPSTEPWVISPRRGDTVIQTDGWAWIDPIDGAVMKKQARWYEAVPVAAAPSNPLHRWWATVDQGSREGETPPPPIYYEDDWYHEFVVIEPWFYFDLTRIARGIPTPPIDRALLKVRNHGNQGPEEAEAEYVMRSHYPYEDPVRIGNLEDDIQNLSVTYEQNTLPIGEGRSIGVRAYPGPYQAWWGGLHTYGGEAIMITANAFRDPKWALLTVVAGYTLTNKDPKSDFRYTSFDELWNSPDRYIRVLGPSLNPAFYELREIYAYSVRGVDLWRLDEYNENGFNETVFRPSHNRSDRFELMGVFHAR